MHYEYAVPTGLAPTTSLLTLFNELDAELWVYVNLAVVVVAAASRALWRRGARLERAEDADASTPSMVAALTILAATMVGVPAPLRWRRKQASSLRIVLTSWILFCLVLSTAYEVSGAD